MHANRQVWIVSMLCALAASPCVLGAPTTTTQWYIPPQEGPVIGSQNGWFVTPADILPGEFFFGVKKPDNFTDTGFYIVPNSVWGKYTYRVTRLADAPVSAKEYPIAPEARAVSSRSIVFGRVGSIGDRELLLNGTVTRVFADAKGFEANVDFAGGPVPCRFDVIAVNLGPKRLPDIWSRRYGPHWQHTFDVYYPKDRGDGPFPVLMEIHGGGWGAFDKNGACQDADAWNARGVAVVSINYRFIAYCQEAIPMTPPVAAPLRDAARALQFVRYHAQELRLNMDKVVLTGGSAGAATACWLAMHDDMADPTSADPIARMSTRVTAIAPVQAQTSLDPRQMREWIPEITYGSHAFLAGKDYGVAKTNEEKFQVFLDKREQLLPWIREYSPYELASKDDPPVLLCYGGQKNAIPAADDSNATHHPQFGKRLQDRLKEVGVTCYFYADDVRCETPRYDGWQGLTNFVMDQLAGPGWDEKGP